jgi:hypothetical protein
LHFLLFFRNQSPFPAECAQIWRVIAKHSAAIGLPTHRRFPRILEHTNAAQSFVPVEIAVAWPQIQFIAGVGIFGSRTTRHRRP